MEQYKKTGQGSRPLSPSSPKGSNFVTRHWRGEYSLAYSYWINGALVTVALLALMMGSMAIMRGAPFGPLGSSLLVITTYAVLVLVTIWQLVGIWRSALLHPSRGGSRFWAVLACILVVVGALRTVATIVTQAVPIVRSTLALAMDRSLIPAYRITLMRDDTEMELAGGMPFGTAAAFEKALDEHPTVKIIHQNRDRRKETGSSGVYFSYSKADRSGRIRVLK